MMGLVATMSLSRLHSLVASVSFWALIGGQMNLWSLDCVKLMHELYVARVFAFCLLCRNL